MNKTDEIEELHRAEKETRASLETLIFVYIDTCERLGVQRGSHESELES